MQGERKVFEGQRRTLVSLVTGLEDIFPFSDLKGQERQLTWVSICKFNSQLKYSIGFWVYFAAKLVIFFF